MKTLVERCTCSECGEIRIKTNLNSPNSQCPKGHGRLVTRTAKELRDAVTVKSLPIAKRSGYADFLLDGHEGVFRYYGRSGIQPVEPGATMEEGWVVAYQENEGRVWIRAFRLKVPKQVKATQ